MGTLYRERLQLYNFVESRLIVPEDVRKSAALAVAGGYPEDAIGILFTGVSKPIPREVVNKVERNFELLDDGSGLSQSDFRRAIERVGSTDN